MAFRLNIRTGGTWLAKYSDGGDQAMLVVAQGKAHELQFAGSVILTMQPRIRIGILFLGRATAVLSFTIVHLGQHCVQQILGCDAGPSTHDVRFGYKSEQTLHLCCVGHLANRPQWTLGWNEAFQAAHCEYVLGECLSDAHSAHQKRIILN